MNTSDILIYQNLDGNIKIDVLLDKETVWQTQAQMGQFFGKDKRTSQLRWVYKSISIVIVYFGHHCATYIPIFIPKFTLVYGIITSCLLSKSSSNFFYGYLLK